MGMPLQITIAGHERGKSSGIPLHVSSMSSQKQQLLLRAVNVFCMMAGPRSTDDDGGLQQAARVAGRVPAVASAAADLGRSARARALPRVSAATGASGAAATTGKAPLADILS